MRDVLEGVDGMKAIVEGILVWCSLIVKHSRKLKQTFNWTVKAGLKLKHDKTESTKMTLLC